VHPLYRVHPLYSVSRRLADRAPCFQAPLAPQSRRMARPAVEGAPVSWEDGATILPGVTP
jgi:hypothetical protein